MIDVARGRQYQNFVLDGAGHLIQNQLQNLPVSLLQIKHMISTNKVLLLAVHDADVNIHSYTEMFYIVCSSFISPHIWL